MGSQESDFNLAGMQECSVHFFFLIINYFIKLVFFSLSVIVGNIGRRRREKDRNNGSSDVERVEKK